MLTACSFNQRFRNQVPVALNSQKLFIVQGAFDVSSASIKSADLQHHCTSALTVNKPAIWNTTALIQIKRVEGTKIKIL